MKLVELLARLLIGGVAAPVMMMFSLPVQSQVVVRQDEGQEDVVEVEEVVVVGTRAQPRSVTQSTVPVNAIPLESLVRQGGSDITDQLRTLSPSFNVNIQPISDAATVVRPVHLRNLAPDHTLVLVNGKRRHRSAVITWVGNGIERKRFQRATAARR